MAGPIQVSSYISTVQKKVAEAADIVQDIQTNLQSIVESSKSAMGDSADLMAFEQKYTNVVERVAKMSADLSDFAAKLGSIQQNYRAAQEKAIELAIQIPK